MADKSVARPWIEGRKAAERGEERDSCPYKRPIHAKQWAKGYDSFDPDTQDPKDYGT